MSNTYDIRELFRTCYRPLCLYAHHYLKDPDAVEDVVQEAFTAWWQKSAGQESVRDARSYLYAMVRNRCIDQLRRQGREPDRLLPEDVAGTISDEQAQERSVLEARLWEAVDRLPARRRQLLLMSKREDMSYAQIAEATGLSVNTVRNQISRALHALQADADSILDFVLLLPILPLP